MTKFARLLVVTLIAVFAAWSVVQAAGATTMALEMAVAPHGEPHDASHGDGCNADELGGSCAILCLGICNSSVVSDVSEAPLRMDAPLAPHTPVPVQLPTGRTYPPSPYPPRLVLA